MTLFGPGHGISLPLVFLAVFASAASATCMAQAQQFRLKVQEDGVYQVDYDELQAAGLKGPVASERLGLENLGDPVAIRVDDGNDGQFGPGDSLVFIGKHLRGQTSHYHDHSPFNVYILATESQSAPRRMAAVSKVNEEPADSASSALRSSAHLERDLLRVPLSGQTGSYGDETLWYWKQINHLASEPTRIPVDLTHLDPDSESAFSLELQFRGWSDYASAAALSVPDHTVEIALNGTPVGQGNWQGRDVHRIEIEAISPSLVKQRENFIEIRVLARHHGEDDEPIIDVVYLDWIKATFPRKATFDDRQQRLSVPADRNTGLLRLFGAARSSEVSPPQAISLFGEHGYHTAAVPEQAASEMSSRVIEYETPLPPGVQKLWIVPGDRFLRSPMIEIDHPSRLSDSIDQRDYFIIAHGSLAKAAEPLAEFHRQRGMTTEVVDVQDIYDEFNFGIEHPRAIRDFLAHALDNRTAPAPSHVLLVGDANWYVKEQANASAERGRNDQRSLIPTWQLRSRDGPAASDNAFVTLTGDDVYPDMAIGRLPANNASEAEAMVEKTIAYMQNPTPGAWRSRVVLVSDSERNLSARNDQLAKRAEDGGLQAVELLSSADDDGPRHQARLRSSIDEGMLVLHFFGHGGRYMWQTAPSRGGNTGNLFDMEDLDQLAPNTRLPIVLSMSCNTGPFDHPAVDSLAEKFVRMNDRGAVAVLAASARNSPSLKFTNALLQGILDESTLGQAVQGAKSARQHPDAALLYNLLGDPALVPARP